MTILVEVKERPILFSAPMVRALLDGRKTQTRRIIDPSWNPSWLEAHQDSPNWGKECKRYGDIGDRLWVRETWARVEPYPSDDSDTADKLGLPISPLSLELYPYWQKRVIYRAGLPDDLKPCDIIERGSADNQWRPSIFMPRWASRITLEITEVRVQRLQDISEEDAKAEGCEPWAFGPEQTMTSGERGAASPYRGGYACLWDEINADRATWKSNPWVWAISFKGVP